MLVDTLNRPIHDLRISVTDRCNFRCGYCMPKDKYGRGHQFLKRKELLTFEEIELIARAFVDKGVVKIRLTGGEPLLRKDLEILIVRLAKIKGLEDLSLTTNASLLTASRAVALREAGLHRINISLDALDDKTFGELNGMGYPVADVLSGIEHAQDAGFEKIKVNMVVQKGRNVASILPMIDYFKGRGLILRFIEYMDVGNTNAWQPHEVFSAAQIKSLIEPHYQLRPLDANYRGEVAQRWGIWNPGETEPVLEIGLIASVTEPFCGDCARARLSAIGEVYTCLFATQGHDLRAVVRDPKARLNLSETIEKIWSNRSDRYSEIRGEVGAGAKREKVEMSYIGG